MQLRGLAVRNHAHVRGEDWEALFEALRAGDGPDDASDDEDEGVVGECDSGPLKGGAEGSADGGSKAAAAAAEAFDAAVAHLPQRLDLATCRLLVVSTNFFKMKRASPAK